MRVLAIPDVHLKPYMFDDAAKIMRSGDADIAVCLGDLADNWGQGLNITLYEQTYDAAINFAKEFPKTLWCYGNHDISYKWGMRESGYSSAAGETVRRKLAELSEAMQDKNQLAFVHRIDNVLFCHGGLSHTFVEDYASCHDDSKDIDSILNTINSLGRDELWQDDSPIWCRPQYYGYCLYEPETFLQVVGHTPVYGVKRTGNLISCDVFSTYDDGTPIGNCAFTIVYTKIMQHKVERL